MKQCDIYHDWNHYGRRVGYGLARLQLSGAQQIAGRGLAVVAVTVLVMGVAEAVSRSCRYVAVPLCQVFMLLEQSRVELKHCPPVLSVGKQPQIVSL